MSVFTSNSIVSLLTLLVACTLETVTNELALISGVTSFEDLSVLVDRVNFDSVVDEFVGVHFIVVKLKLKLLNSQ